ncbi:serine hydrolase domain-containing protein [Methyloceanibacter sp.]|uniref:serine hydrolase domain-containing protein n=1 Tax=Methyloceanibacter sp. TaxID=1965321 RepID=UPI003D6CD18F
MILITALAGGGEAAAQTAERDAKLTETIPKLMEQALVPGAIVGVWKDGEAPYVQAFGVRDTATGEPMATDLSMRIGSVTKTFVTTAILQLVDQGKVGLDDPISKHVPGVPNGDAVTIRQLAGMRSGLFDYTDVTQAAMPDDPQRQYTPQDLLEIISQHPPVFPADTRFDYNNSNTVLLGLVVEKLSGQPLDRYIDEHIVQPERLQHTVFPADATLPSPHARGYTKMPDGKIVDGTGWNPSWGWAAGQMVSTVDDLHVWVRDLATGKLLSLAAQREREKFQIAPSEGDGALYGLGVEYQFGWIGHNGNITGYQTYAYYLPFEKTTMVVMVNSNADAVGVWNFVRDIVKIISPDHPWPAPPSGP